ncbi:hypothetical protein [Mycobacterium uberis]
MEQTYRSDRFENLGIEQQLALVATAMISQAHQDTVVFGDNTQV